MRQQDVNQTLSFCTLLSESCHSRHSTLMSIFPSASSPTLSVLSDEFPGCQTLYLHSPSLFPPLFPLFLHHLWHISVLLPRLWLRVGTGEVVGGGRGWAMVGVHVFQQTERFFIINVNYMNNVVSYLFLLIIFCLC